MSRNIKKMAAISAAVYNHIALEIKAAEAEKQLPQKAPSVEISLTEANNAETVRTDYPVPEMKESNSSSWGLQGRQNIMDQRFMMQYRIVK